MEIAVSERRGFATLQFWVPRMPPRKSNNRDVVPVPKKSGPGYKHVPRLSAKARSYRSTFITEVRLAAKDLIGSGVCPLHTFLVLDLTISYPSDAHDLSVEMVQDCLQAAGVIENDNQVRSSCATKTFAEDEDCGTWIVVSGLRADHEVRKRRVKRD